MLGILETHLPGKIKQSWLLSCRLGNDGNTGWTLRMAGKGCDTPRVLWPCWGACGGDGILFSYVSSTWEWQPQTCMGACVWDTWGTMGTRKASPQHRKEAEKQAGEERGREGRKANKQEGKINKIINKLAPFNSVSISAPWMAPGDAHPTCVQLCAHLGASKRKKYITLKTARPIFILTPDP